MKAHGGITVIRHQCSWEGVTDSGTVLELHTFTESKDPENSSATLKLFQISVSKLLLSSRGSSIYFILRMAALWRSFFCCFFFNPQQLSDPDCSISTPVEWLWAYFHGSKQQKSFISDIIITFNSKENCL